MPHVQARLDDTTFKEVKKDAIDNDVSIADYVKDAVVAKLERSKADSEFQLNPNKEKEN
jgi:hypothetical protein